MRQSNKQGQPFELGDWYYTNRTGGVAMVASLRYPINAISPRFYAGATAWAWEPFSVLLELHPNYSRWRTLQSRPRADGATATVFYSPCLDASHYVIVAGCHIFTSFDEARRHWAKRQLDLGSRMMIESTHSRRVNIDAWSIGEMNRLEIQLSLLQKEHVDATD